MPTTSLKGAHLSLQQSRLWTFQQEGGAYRSQCTVFINGTLDFANFQHTLQHMLGLHTILQTVFYALPGMDIPVQVIGHSAALTCPIIDLYGTTGPKQRALLDDILLSFYNEPFDLRHGPLFRTALFRLSPKTSLLLLILPALCSDAFTLPLLITNLVQGLSGHEPDELPLQYTSVSAWQNQQLLIENEAAKAAHDFWGKIDVRQITYMQLLLEKIGIMNHSARQEIHSHQFEPCIFHIELEETLRQGLSALATRYEVSMPAVLLACWSVLYWRLTGESQLLLGVGCNGRIYEDLIEAPGLYTRFVPFNGYSEMTWSFERIVALVEHQLQAMTKWQSYFTWSSKQATDKASLHSTFFPVTFEYGTWPANFTAADLHLVLDQCFCCTEPFILKLNALQVGTYLRLELHYDPHYVPAKQIANLASMLHVLFHSVVEQPEAAASDLTLLTTSEQKRLLTFFRTPERSLPAHNLHHLFEAQVEQTPQHLAVISSHQQLTYQQLNEQANQLAHILRRHGVGPNVIVGLCMQREAQALVSILAILKAGGAYLPLDPTYPAARLTYQLQTSQTLFLLTQQELQPHLPLWGGNTFSIEELAAQIAQSPRENRTDEYDTQDLAYVIFTSGSTGNPKGVMVQHRSVVNYTLALCKLLDAQPSWQYATGATLAADLGNTAIFCALLSGGCVQILDYELVTSAQAMARWVQQHPIDVLKMVPSHLSALLADESGRAVLPKRALVLGGEALPAKLLARIRELRGTCAVYNHYGPTETTIGVTVNPLGVLTDELPSSVPLGRPIANTQLYILDQRMQLVPAGVAGELYVAGAGVARGYIGQGAQTAERFVPHPYSDMPGQRLYRTGDLVRATPQGDIQFLGRSDQQVKLRGYRIEPGEIETVLRQHLELRNSAVVLQDNAAGIQQLVGYVVPRKMPLPATMDLPGFMRAYLPEYMIPSTFVYIKFLPLTSNGKVDRQRLISTHGDEDYCFPSTLSPDRTARTLIQPRDEIELQLLQIWEEVLQIQPISILDNFFDVGGHSLLAVRITSLITKQFGQDLDLTTLFQQPTISALAVILREKTTSTGDSLLVAIQPHGIKTPFFCVHPAGGTAFCYANLARYLGPDQPFYGIHAPDPRKAAGGAGTIETIATTYIAEIQKIQPQGPYLLGGWSLGGIIAYEMAQQLQKQDYKVNTLAVIDSSIASPKVRANAMQEQLDLEDTGVVKELLRYFKISAPEDFHQRSLDEQLLYAVEQAKKIHALPVDVSLEQVRRYSHTKIVNTHLACLYVPQPYPYHIDYFCSSASTEATMPLNESDNPLEITAQEDRLQPWRELTQGEIDVHFIPGNHQGMVEEPNVQALASALKKCIDQGGF